MNYRVPLCPYPFVNETIGSLLLRTTVANHHLSPHNLLSQRIALKDENTISRVLGDYQLFSEMIDKFGFPKSWLQQFIHRNGPTSKSPYHYMGMDVSAFLVRPDLMAYCPLCLMEEAYWRQEWLFKPYSSCLKHGLMLIENCPFCQTELSSTRAQICICQKCHQDLRHAPRCSIKTDATARFMNILKSGDQNQLREFNHLWRTLNNFKFPADLVTNQTSRDMIIELYFINRDYAATYMAALVNERIAFEHPRIQLLSFLIAEKPLKNFAELVLMRCITPTSPSPCRTNDPAISAAQAAIALGIGKRHLNTLLHQQVLKYQLLSNKHKTILVSDIENLLCYPLSYVPAIVYDYTKLEVTIDEAAHILETNSEVIRSLIKCRWLEAQKYKISSHLKTLICPHSLSSFQNQYILVGTLAHLWHVNSTNLAEKLAELHIFPIAGPHIDGVLTTLF